MGQDFEHVTTLKERFQEFARDTESVGTERVAKANEICDQLIASNHSDAATIAEWKDTLNEKWQDLLELIDTRTQMLQASWERHKFFNDCKELLERIYEKQNYIPDELGRDAQSVAALQRKHANFEQDLVTLGTQVQAIQEESAKLQAAYAGDKAREIQDQEAEVLNAWRNLHAMVETRRNKLADASDLYRFFNLVRDLLLWMDDIIRQMNTQEKPRDVSGVELLMNNHQSLKAEVDAREENFTICINLGKDLLDRKHYRSDEVREKLIQLTTQRHGMTEQWDERWEYLQLILEVYQFARDAAVAEAWLVAQEPYLLNHDLGDTLDAVDTLIKKHEAFEKSAATQEERFAALEKLTTFEIKERKRREDDEYRQEHPEEMLKEREDKLKQLIQEFLPPEKPPTPEPVAEPPTPVDQPDVEEAVSPAVAGEAEAEPKLQAGGMEEGEPTVKLEKTPQVEAVSAHAEPQVHARQPSPKPSPRMQGTPPSPRERERARREAGRRSRPEEMGHPQARGEPAPSSRTEETTPPPAIEKKRRSRSKSPFGKFFRKKDADTLPAKFEGDTPPAKGDTLPAKFEEQPSPGTSAMVHEEGMLVRKHEWEAHNKKAGNRSWDKVYVVLHNNALSCYKDQKHAKQDPSTRVHHESAFDLAGAECEPATDYTKRPHVFRLRLASGAEYLFQAKDQAEMESWLGKVLEAGASGEASAMPTKSQTMPAGQAAAKEKKKPFFTLKKK